MRIRLILPVCAAAAVLVGAAWTTASSQARPFAACRITQSHSLSGRLPATIRFVNATGGTVTVDWLDFTGKPVVYATLAPGKSAVQGTFVGHAWEVLDSSGACVAYTVAKAQTVAIRGTCHVAAKRSLVGTQGATLRFVNRTSGAVTLYWLSYKGQRISYGKLAKKASRSQATFVTNAWEAVSASGKCVGYAVGRASAVRVH